MNLKGIFNDNAAQWIVLEEEMQTGFINQLASIEDLHDYVAASGEYFTYYFKHQREMFNGIQKNLL